MVVPSSSARALQAPGEGRLLRHPHPGAGRRARHPADRQQGRPAASTASTTSSASSATNLNDPVDQRTWSTSSRPGCSSCACSWSGSSTAAATASCWSPSATPRSACASSATTRRTSSWSPSSSPRVHGRHRRGAVRAGRRHHLAGRRSARPPRSCSSPASRSAAGPRCSARCSARSPSATGQSALSERFPTRWTYFQGAAVHRRHRSSCPGGIVVGAGRSSRPRARSPVAGQPRSRGRSDRRGGREERDVRDRATTLEVRDLHGRLRRLQGRRRRRPRRCTPGDLRFLIGPNGAGKTTWSTPSPGSCRPPASARLRRPGAARQEGAPDRPARRRPHVPDRDGLRGADRAAEPRHRRRRCTAGAGPLLLRRRKRARRASSEALETIGLDRAGATARPGSSRTARSSGWRSACCSCRTPRCCCSTSRSPA